eukprot:s288_g46.t1
MCDHIADDAIDLRPDGTDPRDAEQVKLYIHHLPVTDLTFLFSQLHREVRLLRDEQARQRQQLGVLAEWAAASDQTLAGPLGLLMRPEDGVTLVVTDVQVVSIKCFLTSSEVKFSTLICESVGGVVTPFGTSLRRSFMNLKKGAEENCDSREAESSHGDGSVNSETVHIPLPDHIDDLWPLGETDSLQYEPSETYGASGSAAAIGSDGYFDPGDEAEEKLDSDAMKSFSDLITDKCLGVPPTMAVNLPWEEGIFEQIFGESDGIPRIPVPQMAAVEAKKIVELSDLHRKEKRQARVLTVQEVQALELTLLDETEEIADRYAAGAFLFCLYSRSRLSDLRKVRGYYKDILESNGTITGYLEFRTRSHKTSRLVAKQGLAMPLVAPVWGLLSPPWGLTFARVASLASETGTGTWQGRAVTTTEAGNWVRSLLSKRLGEIDYTTIHALKSTPLSWCAKAGLDQPTRLLLGHHTTGKQSADVYARDVLAAPLREFDTVLQNIRNGSLRPDATRSGMVGNVTDADPKDSYVVPRPAETDDKMSESSSSSESETSSADESHAELLLPGDPVGEEKTWEVVDLYIVV